jgi:primosomal protein N' (replication factor Y) (superfamily II helicase)
VFISVAAPVPALPLLTYRVPPDLGIPVRGARVLVPLGRRTVTGLVIGPAEGPAPDVVRDIERALDETPFVPDSVIDLALWIADYYMASPGDALGAALPPFAWIESETHFELTESGRVETAGLAQTLDPLLARLARGRRPLRALVGRGETRASVEARLRSFERAGVVARVHAVAGRAASFKTEAHAAVTAAGLGASQATAGAARLTEPQRDALSALAASADGMSLTALRDRGIPAATVRRLAARGLVVIRQEIRDRDPFAADAVETTAGESRVLTDEQSAALATLTRLADEYAFQTALVQGVTGSGKTEVYLRLARHVIAGDRRVLILVPEIALTPQVAAYFRAAFGDRVAIQHSGLSPGERHDQWHRIKRGDVDLIVGTRSAVFAPIERLGLIVVDEEHDPSYKQDETPRYHGRDVAIVRGRGAKALVVLGSATPSLESAFNAESGRYTKVVLARRVLDRPLADVAIVDLREEYAAEGPDVILGRRLVAEIGERLTKNEQSLLLLNRRGFSTAVFCRQCGHVLDCPNCSVSLTVHHERGQARGICHYCNYSLRVPTTCAKCAAPYLEQSGFGTERVEAEVLRLFPAARVGRVDRDTMQKRGAVTRMLKAFGAHELDLLVGTQMIAKGHDFPRVTLVGVVSADMGLGLADFRAAERTFQLLTQVAGRAGRGERRGIAIVQTINPDHYSIRLACRQDYDAFYREELRYRQAMRYPPAVSLINVVVRGKSYAEAMGGAHDLASQLRVPAGTAVLGPAPAPIAKLRGEYRAQMFLKTRHRTAARRALAAALAARPELLRRVAVDVDPVGLL